MASQRHGITVIEVIVILVIVLVLLGLLLLYLVRTREAANQVQCANNLRLLGEGIYHAQGKRLPEVLAGRTGGAFLPPSRIDDGYGTWAVQLAPFLTDKRPLAGWDLRLPYAEQAPATREAAFALFLCPARSRPGLLSTEGDTALGGKDNIPGAVGDYACASADGDTRFPWDSDKANGAIIPARVLEKKDNTILLWRSRTDLKTLKRGLSNTILLGEKHVPVGRFGEAAVGDGSLYNGGSMANFARVGGPGFGLARLPGDPFNRNFGSYHENICQFLMADDSVRVLANDVSETLLGELIRRE